MGNDGRGLRAFRVAYDGQPYYGFQRQPDVPTVEDAVFNGLRELDVLDAAADKPPAYAAAGRTDRGVSAVAQTVAFECPEWLTPAALNGELPATIRAWASAEAPAEFHATHDATARTYTYHLHAPAADVDRAREALSVLAGEHDLHNLTLDDSGTVRTLEPAIEPDGEFLVIELRAGGFSRQLVRRIVALVRDVATGAAPLSKIGRVLSPTPLSGPEGVGPAPAAPLVLTDVSYPGLDFHVDSEAATSARSVFEQRRIAAVTEGRVAGSVRDEIGE
ncbi:MULTISPECIES: tRNA pseudouridine(38-40) synthase TruA [Halococcus]|uniref:tRNA pseudouridine synthase A n=1 Tax=Halococcus salifodinae DSM 8989 TaxID=1227456 RepID=M0MZZ7_9EURY|nr:MULTISPECIES: tRNA pseudouridine(38-40) synthase TruA [Halococcus]EMA49985.1 tRNA pseudouridine synthase A [Halococcus salifodinae DSM 8989]